jgi:hypothetical protein
LRRLPRAALRSVQVRLENLYALEPGPNVVDFVWIGCEKERERLFVRQAGDLLELALRLPPRIMAVAELGAAAEPSDAWLQLIEGVSHFVHVVHRARADLPTTLLELELQAEVDKFVLLALADQVEPDHFVSRTRAARLHQLLYEEACYVHPPGTKRGDRYRVANRLAARFVIRLLAMRSPDAVFAALRRFYRSGQADKVWLATAA